MKKLFTFLVVALALQSAKAGVTLEQQQEALKQLEVARAEINTLSNLIPSFLRSTLARGLENADQRIAYAQKILAIASVSTKFYCTIDSSFDGSFWGRGNTELEASNNAKDACVNGSRNNGFFCRSNTTKCQREP